MGKLVDDLELFLSIFRRSHHDAASLSLADTVGKLAGEFEAQLSKINADRNLSDQGQQAGRHQARLDLAEQLDRLREDLVVGQLDKMIARTKEALIPKPEVVDPVVALTRELRNQSILRQLENLNQNPMVLAATLDELPPEVAEALRSAPPRPAIADNGTLVWESLAPDPVEPTSPELEALENQRIAVEGVISQLSVEARVPEALAEQLAADQAAEFKENTGARQVD